jgi:hypothetical protein
MSTTTYKYPVSGTVPPTAAQVAKLSMVVAEVQFGSSETAASITHNFGLSGTQAGFDWPTIIPELKTVNGATLPPVISFARTNTNLVTINKVAVVNSDCTVVVTILRPPTQIAGPNRLAS